MNYRHRSYIKISKILTILAALALPAVGFASSYCDGAYGLKEVFCNVLLSYDDIANLIGGFAYTMGVAFGVAAVFKFKQYRESPAQLTLGHSIAYLTTSVGLIYLPSLITNSAESIFQSSGINEEYQMADVSPDVWTGA